jgi:beta-glucosidase
LSITVVDNLKTNIVQTVGADVDWETSTEAARESVTLVKNEDKALPLSRTAKVLLTGPAYDSLVSQTGSWSFHWQGPLSNDEFTKGITVAFAMSSGEMTAPENVKLEARGPKFDSENLNDVEMDDILSIANTVDVIIVCVGEGTYAEKPGDIDDLSMAQGQVLETTPYFLTAVLT